MTPRPLIPKSEEGLVRTKVIIERMGATLAAQTLVAAVMNQPPVAIQHQMQMKLTLKVRDRLVMICQP